MRTSATICNMDAHNGPRVPEWSLSDRLRKIRRDAHLTQGDMARRLGVKSSTWAAWEAGRNRPDDVVELAEVVEREFSVPAAWTLGVLDRGGRSIPAQRHVSVTGKQWEALAVNLTPERLRARA